MLKIVTDIMDYVKHRYFLNGVIISQNSQGKISEDKIIMSRIIDLVAEYKLQCKDDDEQLREAIDHARDVQYNSGGQYDHICEECRAEHGQLAEWLSELHEYRQIQKEIFAKAIDNQVEMGYNT